MRKLRKTEKDQDSYIMIDTCEDGSLTMATKRIDFTSTSTRTICKNVLKLRGKLTNEVIFVRTQNTSCDVYLKCDDGVVFSAHKNILSMISPYFEAMFHSNMIEKVQAVINIRCVTSQSLKHVIRFAYSAETSVPFDEELFDLLLAANMLCVRDIETQCLDFLGRNLDMENCVDVLNVSEMICCEELYMIAFNFLKNNFRQFVRQPNFYYLAPQHLELLLSNDCLDVAAEADVFDAVILWTCHDTHARESYLPQLLRQVRLMLLSRKYLVDRVLRESTVMANEEARNIVLDVLDCHMLPERTCLLKLSSCVGACLPRQSLNRKIYVIGGQENGISKTSAECYNFRTKLWSTLPQTKYPRHSSCAVVLDGQLYVIGGVTCNEGGRSLSVVEKFNPVTEIWSLVSSLRSCSGAVSAVVMDGWIYCAGGSQGRIQNNTTLKDAEQYDVTLDRWTKVPDMNIARTSFAAGELFCKLYVTGGHSGISELSHCERYDPSRKEWTKINGLNTSRTGHSAVTLNNRMYVYGGKNSLGLVHSVEKYNPELNMWLVIKTNFETSLGMVVCLRMTSSTSGEAEDRNVIIVGGRDGDNDDKETSSVSLASLQSPEVRRGKFTCMLEKRAFAAVAML